MLGGVEAGEKCVILRGQVHQRGGRGYCQRKSVRRGKFYSNDERGIKYREQPWFYSPLLIKCPIE